VCVAVCVAVCDAVCDAVCVAVCVAVCDALCVAVCVAVYSSETRQNTCTLTQRLKTEVFFHANSNNFSKVKSSRNLLRKRFFC